MVNRIHPWLAGVLCGFLTAAAARAQNEAPEGEPFQEMTPEIRLASIRGLRWLATHQNPSGSYGNGSAPVATTGIAAMAFLAGGHLPGRSTYGENVKKALGFLLQRLV